MGRTAGLAVTRRRVLRSEWIKLRTVRSTIVGFAGAAFALVVLGAIFSSVAGGDAQAGPPGDRRATRSPRPSAGSSSPS